MPVGGLPAAEESDLNAVLMENNASSWKVVAERRVAANMSDSNNSHGQYLRLKPPSLIKRIRKDPEYEKSSQQKEIRQAAFILVFPLESDQQKSEV